jgi:5-methylcytosine-specific restriction endonuclease McrA
MESRKEKARLRAQAWRDKQPKKARSRTCGHCGSDITPLHSNARYCSEECKRIYVNISSRKYRETNKGYYASQSAKRRSAKLERTPGWVEQDDIDALYVLARKLTELTGVPMDVDHIIPLQGSSVSGLHVPRNLQLLARPLNRSKHNKWDTNYGV